MEAWAAGALFLLPADSAFSYVGAAAVSWLPKEALRPLILVLLVLAAGYTLARKDFGQVHRPAHAAYRELGFAWDTFA